MSSIREGSLQSTNDKKFIVQALRSGRRMDGRRPSDMRLLRMVFSRAEGKASAEIQLGRTRVLAVVTCEVVPPYPDRPTEGFLLFNVEFGPMAASTVGERNSSATVEIARIIEVGVRDSQAIDTEALCILGGEKVWQVRCDVHVLDHGGNLTDACALGTMAALRHFRRPEVTIDGSKITVHHTDDKEPQPLALHHIPICVTFAIFEDNDTIVGGSSDKSARGVSGSAGFGSFKKRQYTLVDPTEAEEEVMKGRITFALTQHKELCALHKNGGVAISSDTILECARLAAVKVVEVYKVLEDGLQGADKKATRERQARLRGKDPSAVGPSRIPGTNSTPFAMVLEPLPVAPESLKVKHLGYDDLHATQSIREEGLRGGSDRGLSMADARNTDLFARMARAASMTAASMAEGQKGDRSDGSERSAPPRTSPGNTRVQQDGEPRHRVKKIGGEDTAERTSGTKMNGGEVRLGRALASAPSGDSERSQSGRSAPRNMAADVGFSSRRDGVEAGDGRERGKVGPEQVSEEAMGEFARLAKTLRAGKGEDSVGTRRVGDGAGGKRGTKGAMSPMEVDSDEEVVTLTGDFPRQSVAPGLQSAGTHASSSTEDATAGAKADREGLRAKVDGSNVGGGDGDDGDDGDDDDDDLALAVKVKAKGKGRGRGKAGKLKKTRQRG